MNNKQSGLTASVQGDYSRWMQAQGDVPSFFDVAGFPEGFEPFWEERPICLFNLRCYVFEALQFQADWEE